MNNNPNHILFYSKYCNHSKDFFSKLLKTDYNNKFVKICVDNKNYKIPSFIKTVPTIIVPQSNTPLTGNNVFNWLDSVTSQNNNNSNSQNFKQNSNNEVLAFSGEMCGLSDQYSLIENQNNSQFERTFSFIESQNSQQIYTPQDSNESGKDKLKSSTDTAYERLLAERAMDTPNDQRMMRQ